MLERMADRATCRARDRGISQAIEGYSRAPIAEAAEAIERGKETTITLPSEVQLTR